MIGYCNDSYTSGNVNNALITGECVLINTISPNNNPNHCHGLDCYYVSSLTSNIEWTSHGYFIFGTLGVGTTNSWYLDYLENDTYELGTTSFDTTSNFGGSWNDSNYLFTAHIHQYSETDGISYNVAYIDNESNTITSTNVIDYLDFVNNSPSPVLIINPLIDSVYTLNSTGLNITFNWTESFDIESDSIKYKVGITNSGLNSGVNLSNNLSVLNYTHSFNSDEWSNGNYRAYVYSINKYGYSSSFMNGYFSLCVNDWVSTEQICIDGISNNTYNDLNNCPLEYEKPDSFLTNCTIETGNTDLTLIIIWVLFGLLSIFLIARGHSIGWVSLGIIVLMFSFTSLPELTDVVMLHVLGYLLGIIFLTMTLIEHTLKP
jgi:hypothetical protein